MIGDECRGVGWWASALGLLSTAVTAGSGRRGGGAWSLARAAGWADRMMTRTNWAVVGSGIYCNLVEVRTGVRVGL